MRHFSLFVIIVLAATSAFAVTVPTPTNFTAFSEKYPDGQQYIQVQFADSSLSRRTFYYIVRWKGSIADTTERTEIGPINRTFELSPGAYYDDTSYLFNPSHLDPNYTRSYSYAVYA